VARPRDIAGSRTGRQRQREEDRERGEQEGGRKNRERRGEKGAGRGTGGPCVFVLLKARGPALSGKPHCGNPRGRGLPRGRSGRSPPAMAEAAVNAKFTLGKLPLPSVGRSHYALA